MRTPLVSYHTPDLADTRYLEHQISAYIETTNQLTGKKYSYIGIPLGILGGLSIAPAYMFFGQNGIYNLSYHFSHNQEYANQLKSYLGTSAGIFGALNNLFFMSLGINHIFTHSQISLSKPSISKVLTFFFVHIPSSAGAPFFTYQALTSWQSPIVIIALAMIFGEILAAINNRVNINLLLYRHLCQIHCVETLFLHYATKRQLPTELRHYQTQHRINHALETLLFGLSDEQVTNICGDITFPTQDPGTLLSAIQRIEQQPEPTKRLWLYRICQTILLILNTIAASFFIGPGKQMISPITSNNSVTLIAGIYLMMLNMFVLTQASFGVLKSTLTLGQDTGMRKWTALGTIIAVPPALVAFLQAYFLGTTEKQGPMPWIMTVASMSFIQNLLLGAFSVSGLFFKPAENSAQSKRQNLAQALQGVWNQPISTEGISLA